MLNSAVRVINISPWPKRKSFRGGLNSSSGFPLFDVAVIVLICRAQRTGYIKEAWSWCKNVMKSLMGTKFKHITGSCK